MPIVIFRNTGGELDRRHVTDDQGGGADAAQAAAAMIL